MTLTDANALALVLGLTAVFNVIQLAFACAVSYAVLKLPRLADGRAAGRPPWFVSVTRGRPAPDS